MSGSDVSTKRNLFCYMAQKLKDDAMKLSNEGGQEYFQANDVSIIY